MATTWTISNKVDSIANIHPGIPIGKTPQSGMYSGAYRAIRCALTASGTYTTGGDDLLAPAATAGIKHLEAVLLVTDAVPDSNGQVFRYNIATGKVQLYGATDAEITAATATTGVYQVILLGRSG